MDIGGVFLVDFVLSAYVTELKNAWRDTIANENLIQLLYDSIIEPLNLTDANGEYITVKKEMASRLMNRHDNVSPRLRKEVDNPAVIKGINVYFEDLIVPELIQNNHDEVLHKMMLLINKDPQISDNKKSEFSVLAQKDTIAQFLASTFLFAITRENKISKSVQSLGKEKEDFENGTYRRKPLTSLTPPIKIAEEETPYIVALMQAYGEAEEVDNFSSDMLESFPKHKRHFIKQREYYHLAEAVRRGTRDMYSENDPDQFEVLKDETYEGVIEVWEDSYENGLVRLRNVLKQAGVIRVDKCWLSRDTDWIGNSQKKGVCHFLVNDKRIQGWVNDDED